MRTGKDDESMTEPLLHPYALAPRYALGSSFYVCLADSSLLGEGFASSTARGRCSILGIPRKCGLAGLPNHGWLHFSRPDSQ